LRSFQPSCLRWTIKAIKSLTDATLTVFTGPSRAAGQAASPGATRPAA